MIEQNEHAAAWEERYRARPQVWSGRVNTQLAALVPRLNGSRALDLGCGEGADAIWLAERGWSVVAVDVSDTALTRARAEADSRGVGDRIDFQQYELTSSFPDGAFDLVSAQFLHSTVPMDRAAILRRAAGAVAPGGALLIVDHAGPPPWATALHHHDFPTAEAVAEHLALDPAHWRREISSVERAASSPDGQDVTLTDNVILLTRTPLQEDGAGAVR